MMFRFAFAAFALTTLASPAMAEPRIVALSEHDEAAYRAAFAAIEAGNWRGVGGALAHAEDDILAGAVRGRMLLSRSYRPSWGEYSAWLNRYGDYGMAEAIYDRAMASRRRRSRAQAPIPDDGPNRQLPGTPPAVLDDSAAARVAIQRIAERIGAGDDAGARELAGAQLSGPRAGQAAWQLGLIAYRAGDFTEASAQFEAAALWPHHGGWAKSAVHYWAARAGLALGQTTNVVQHFEAAADRPWTFYGQLAEAQLGRDSALRFEAPPVEADRLAHFVERHPGARRAAALAQLGRLSEVESELRRLHADLASQDDHAYLALAIALQAPSAQLRAADLAARKWRLDFARRLRSSPRTDFRSTARCSTRSCARKAISTRKQSASPMHAG